MPILALALWLQIARTADAVRLVVVVSASQPITNISSSDVRAIYLGQNTRWPNHRPILPILVPLDSLAGRMFLRRFVGMADVDYAQHWIGVVFRGEASSPPLITAAGEQAARFVAAHPEAIALLATMPAEKNVRVLTVDGKPPDAADYPLRW